MGELLTWVALLLCIVAAYFISNAIAQRSWKEKIPQSKLIGFTVIFVISFSLLFVLMTFAAMMAFGR